MLAIGVRDADANQSGFERSRFRFQQLSAKRNRLGYSKTEPCNPVARFSDVITVERIRPQIKPDEVGNIGR